MTPEETKDSPLKAFAIAHLAQAIVILPSAWMAQIACAEFWRPVPFWAAFAALWMMVFVGKLVLGKQL